MNQENNVVRFINEIAEVASDKNVPKELPLIITQTIKLSGCPFIKPNLVSIRNSSRHGFGVFANQEIKQGEIVCLYPADFVKLVDNDNGKEGWCSSNEDSILDIHYSMNLLDDKQICADPTKYISLFSAHMINDSVSCETIKKLEVLHNNFDNCDINEFGKGINRYLLETKKNSNVELTPSKYCCYVKAKKDIQPNEELLTSYGFPYWLNNIDWNSNYAKYLASINQTQRNLFINLITETHLCE